MAKGGGAARGWDGWVLYTSKSGYKYHWNHLTHESRWAIKEPSTQQQRMKKPQEGLDGGMDIGTMEEGEDKKCNTDGSIPPHAGTGPMTVSDVDRVPQLAFPSHTGAKTSYCRDHRSQIPPLRRCHRTPRDSKPSAQRVEQKRIAAANSKKVITATLVGEMAGLSRQKIASAVHAALRAVVGSWTGVASAARTALRKWKLHRGLNGPILPIAVDKSDLDENRPSSDETLLHEAQDYGGQVMGHAPFRSFLPKAPGPPNQSLSWSRSDVNVVVRTKRSEQLQGVHIGYSTVEGLSKSVEEVGSWIGGNEGVTEEQIGGYNLIPSEVVRECSSKKHN